MCATCCHFGMSAAPITSFTGITCSCCNRYLKHASIAVEVKQCTRRDGSGGERLNKQALSFSSLGWPSASGHHAAVLVRKIRSSSSRCELVLCRCGRGRWNAVRFSAHQSFCRVCDDAVAGAQDGREEVWLSVCCEASGLLRKRADVCRR